jgi:MoaA/NifB/PqqE/SkfB family radical SAM enzyme
MNLAAWVDLSTYCNAACPQCHRTNPDGLGKQDWLPLVQWSLESFKKAFPPESLIFYERIELCGTWGDPLMNKDIFKIVKYILESNDYVIVHINTNGSIRSKKWWKEFGELSSDRLFTVFDIDGINQEMHEKYRQGTLLHKIKENVEAYVSTGAQAQAFVIAFLHNEDYLDDIHNMIRDWGITGKITVIESNRFYQGQDFKFKKNGKEESLEQTTISSDEFENPSVRDHRWRKKFDASGRTKSVLS